MSRRPWRLSRPIIAETIDLPLKLGSYEELRYSHDLVDVSGLPKSKVGFFDPFDPILWIEGRDLVGGKGRWIPFELVHANYTLPALTGSGAFVANTNGLASGNSLLEAQCHGLYEVVERDAVTLWKLMAQSDQDERALDPDSIDDPACREILDLFAASEIDVALWDVTSDVGIASFLCLIAGRDEATGAPEFGAGSHLCRSVALSRALTEAAQARTTYIAGSRDDITAEHYEESARKTRHATARDVVAAHRPRRSYDQVPDLDLETFEDDLAAILAALTTVGMNEAYTVDLSKSSLGVPVVRIVVPGLETALESPDADYVPGERAMAVLEGRP